MERDVASFPQLAGTHTLKYLVTFLPHTRQDDKTLKQEVD